MRAEPAQEPTQRSDTSPAAGTSSVDVEAGVVGVRGDVRTGLIWSTLNNVTLRVGSLLVGVVLARLLTPQQFGVYAVALTVQTVLMTLSDLGLSADLVRSREPERRAPTVATLGLVSGALLALLMFLTAEPLASALGSPQSSTVIAALSLTLVLSGAGVVPYAMLNRQFEQRRLFAIAGVDFLVGTLLTLFLVSAGWGVMALAVGRVSAQAVTLWMQFWLSGVRPRFGVDRTIVGSVVSFGVPLAAANLLSWALLGADKAVIATAAGPVALGFYVLAFNVSTWPMSGIGQVVRSVALPAFARMQAEPEEQGRALASGLALAWGIALPAGVLLAATAEPLITALYGRRWQPAVPALAALGIFGALRVLFDLVVAYLMSRGHARPVLYVQVLWLLLLVPVLLLLTERYGIAGAGWSHVVVATCVVLPAYLVCLRRCGAGALSVLTVLWPPVVAAAPAGTIAWFVSSLPANPWWGLIAGGASGLIVYAACMFRWLHRWSRSGEGAVDAPAAPPAVAEGTGLSAARVGGLG